MLKKYKTLIQSLPVDEMASISETKIWKKFHDKSAWLEMANESIFGNTKEITLTRGQLKSPPENMRHFILKVIYWGYARGMRGNHFEEIIKKENIGRLENLLKMCSQISDFQEVFKEVGKVKGIAISTFTKFLYFLNAEIEGQKALILDKQIIHALSRSPFQHPDFKKLESRNAHDFYVKYLQKMAEWADELETRPENIEQFLFMFHRGLRPNNT